MKKIVLYFVMILTVCLVAACSNSTSKETANEEKIVDYAKEVKENPTATITMQDGQQIVMELYPKVAPNTVANFIALAKEKFYDGLTFQRVIPGFMIQGGDPQGDGSGGPGYTIDGEFSANDFENDLKHERGVLSMARTGEPNSAGSQFFIMVEDVASLDTKYAAFGKVLSGMETVDMIVNVETDSADKPLKDQVMKTIEIDTKGFEYPAPVKNK